jgi:hypothetical protein
MSLAAIRTALQTQLAAALPSVDLTFENAPYRPTTGRPYVAAYVLLAQPDNSEIGPGYTDQGIFQANLFYPKDKGPGDAIASAEAIRTAFPFAASFVSGGTVVIITATPEVSPARAEDDRYLVPVKVRFQSRTGG